jgi:predicted ATPase
MKEILEQLEAMMSGLSDRAEKALGKLEECQEDIYLAIALLVLLRAGKVIWVEKVGGKDRFCLAKSIRDWPIENLSGQEIIEMVEALAEEKK